MAEAEAAEMIRNVTEQCIECRRCMKDCLMLREGGKTPKALLGSPGDPAAAYRCNECGLCALRCPRHLNPGAAFQALKRRLAGENGGTVPLKALAPSEARQEKECAAEYCTTLPGSARKAQEKKKTRYVFVPGCTVPAYSPRAVELVVRHLKDCLGEENVGAMLRCCGKVSRFMGEEEKFRQRNQMALDELDRMGAEVIITVCPSCFKVFKETAKNQRVISYWDLMHDLIGIPPKARNIGKGSDVTFNIHDSCVTRDEPTHHESIRWVLDEMGYRWEEISCSKGNTRCCGVGGMVCSSDPELYKRIYTRRKEDFSQEHVISYCGSCRGTFETADMDSLHILDLLFGEETYMAARARKRGCGTEEKMWANRLETRDRLNAMKD